MVGVVAALVTASLWALTAMMVKVEARRVSVLSINAYRATVGMVALLTAFFLLRDPRTLLEISPTSYAVLGVSVLLGMVGGGTCNFLAIMRIGLGRAFPISGAYPLLTIVIASTLFQDEQMGPAELVGALLVLGGVILVAVPSTKLTSPLDRRNNLIGVGLAVAAAIFWALSSIVTKIGMSGLELLTATAIRLPMAAVALWLLLVVREGWPPTTPPWRLTRVSALSIVVAGLLGPALSNYLWMLGIQEIGAARTDVLAATGPIFAVILAAVVLREPVSRRVIAGTLLSVVGIMLVVARLST